MIILFKAFRRDFILDYRLCRRIFAIALLAAATLAPRDAQACGYIQNWMAKYNRAGASDDVRRGALGELSGNCQGYVAKRSDRKLLSIVADALARGFAPKTVQRVFDTFRCLPGARGDAKYATVSKVLDMSKCPTPAELRNWYVAVVDYAIIRRGPGKFSAKTGWVRRGAVVKASRATGKWLKIIDWHGQKGFIYRPLLHDYLTFEPPGAG